MRWQQSNGKIVMFNKKVLENYGKPENHWKTMESNCDSCGRSTATISSTCTMQGTQEAQGGLAE